MGAAPIVVITGCTRGLGRALVEYFVGENWIVVGCGRDPERIERLRAEIGERHEFSTVDVREDVQVGSWAAKVVRRFGAPDLLLNNAAVIARNAPVWEVPVKEADSVLGVNVAGTINTLRHYIPPMLERSRSETRWNGVIVNFSSGWGRSTSPEVGIYCASKWAIEGLTQSLAQDLAGSRVHAYALNPGIIDTSMLRECFGDAAGHYPKPDAWIREAGPFVKSLVKRHPAAGDCSITVPGVPVD